MSIADIPVEDAGALQVAGRSEVRGEVLRQLVRSPTFIVGAIVLLVWIICAIFGSAIAPHSPYAQNLLGINKAPSSAHLFGTDQLGRDMFSRVIVGSRDILIIAPLATLLGTVLGTVVGLFMGYFRGWVDDVLGRFVEAFLALPIVVTGVIALSTLGRSNLTLIIVIGLAVHAADRAHRARRGAARARARLRLRRLGSAASARRTSCSSRSSRTCSRRSWSSSPFGSAYAIFAVLDADVPRPRHSAAVARLGARHLVELRLSCPPATGGRCCSTRWRSRRWWSRSR